MVQIGHAPFWPIDGPSPQAPPYTLLGASRVVDDIDETDVQRWINGVKVYPYPPDAVQVWDPTTALGSASGEKVEGGTVGLPDFGAMTAYLAETCTSRGIFGGGMSKEQAQERFVSRALAAFSAVESAALEREFLAGEVLGSNPHLSDGEGDFPGGNTAVSVVEGIGLLENEIAASGRRGMIHVSPALAISMSALTLLIQDGSVLRTFNGTIVVPGYGYAESVTPDGRSAAGPGEEWAYATGPVEVRRSEVFLTPETLSEALDRETNSITYRVERYYLVDWDAVVQAAVKIDRGTLS